MNKPINKFFIFTLAFAFITCISLAFFPKNTYAQLSKDEKKKLLAEIKKISPESLKKMKEEAENPPQKAKNDEALATKRLAKQNALIESSKKDESVVYLEEKMRTFKKENPDVNASKQQRTNEKCAFSVQIGAYKNQDLTQYMEKSPNFGVESDESGMKKYVLGYFSSYWEAKYFSKYLDSLGGKSYVVGFYQGKRIPDLKDMTDCTF